MSIFWVIFILFSLDAAIPPPQKPLDDIFEEWKADDGSHHGTNHTCCPCKIGREAEEIHRIDLDDLSRYRFPAFLAVLLIHKPQI